MIFIYVLGFVVFRDVVKVFPVRSPSFARKTTGRNRARSLSGAWRGQKTKWDLKLSLPSQTYLIRYLFIEVGTTTPKLKLDAFLLWQLRSLNSPSFSDPSGIPWWVRGFREAPAPRDSLNFRRASLPSRNEFQSVTFTIVLHATSSFTYVSVIYGANFPFKYIARSLKIKQKKKGSRKLRSRLLEEDVNPERNRPPVYTKTIRIRTLMKTERRR